MESVSVARDPIDLAQWSREATIAGPRHVDASVSPGTGEHRNLVSRLGLEQYEQTFPENDIDAQVPPELLPNDLFGLGVISVGHRRRLVAAIHALRRESVPSIENRELARPPQKRYSGILKRRTAAN